MRFVALGRNGHLALGIVIFLVLAVLLAAPYFSASKLKPKFSLTSIKNFNCTRQDLDFPPQLEGPISSIVHYVWLLKDPKVFRLEFKFFISVYSTHLYLKPDMIYIHTDASREMFIDARIRGDEWTRRVLGIPNVVHHYVPAPLRTEKGVAITHLEHKADFLRTEALIKFGGIYLDSDAIPLRSMSSLRHAGFANIVGGAVALKMKHTGFINNGVMMSVAGSSLMKIYLRTAQEYFDGVWATASVFVLTDLVDKMGNIEGEVLVLGEKAFAPMSWEREDQIRLFKPHLRPPTTISVPKTLDHGSLDTCQEKYEWLRWMEALGTRKEDWEIDFSSSYVLHAFDDEVGSIGAGWDGKITLDYVLARRSNYARAVFPAISHAIDAGVIPNSLH